MTREEASRHLHNDWYIENGHLCVYENARDLFLEAVGMGIKALRPVSREAWTAEWTVDEVGHKCSKCGEYLPDGEDVRKPQFCPECGRAMTDEAVEMVMERLEALKDGKDRSI